MSGSLTVLCPNGHRVKVSTTPNMALLAVKETACSKKGYDPGEVELCHRGKKIDLSSTVRFSGLPNNATLDMEELSQEDIERLRSSVEQVTVCLQLETERMVADFASSTDLKTVMEQWRHKLGEKKEGEVAVMVYMRQEIVGDEQMKKTTLRSLGLTKGKGLFRFFYKLPEVLKTQANVYDMKEKAKKEETPERTHLPMRLEPENVKYEEFVEAKDPPMEINEPAVKVEEMIREESPMSEDINVGSSTSFTRYSTDASGEPEDCSFPDSTSNPIVKPVGPHSALVFLAESPSSGSLSSSEDVLDDNFFSLSLEEVKSLYKDLKEERKKLEEGEMLMTTQMKEAAREGEKLALISRYKSGLLRVQLPSRHIVQGKFPPTCTVQEVTQWLEPLLKLDTKYIQLYMAPPRTVLQPAQSLLELNLFPAALVHLSVIGGSERQDLLTVEVLANLSNLEGANQEAKEMRRVSARQKPVSIGIQGSVMDESIKRKLIAISEEQSSTIKNETSFVEAPKEHKMPKWFKPGK